MTIPRRTTPRLLELAPRVSIARYREDLTELTGALEAEGFQVEAPWIDYTPEEQRYSQSIRCMITHRQIWRLCAARTGFSFIVEADFVPVVGLGQLRVPFDPGSSPQAFAWLYACSPTLYQFDDSGGLVGDASGMVAYLIDPETAGLLVEFADRILAGPDPSVYRAWDSELRHFLRDEHDIPTYVPYRHFGEHGGRPNPEHRVTGNFPPHRAECLAGRLRFLPAYAEGSRLRFLGVRAGAKARGVIRLLLDRTWPSVSRNNVPDPRVSAFAVTRLLTPY